MITEDHISFGTAKLLKEKRFDDVCHAFYDKDGIFVNLLQFVGNNNFKRVNEDKITFAPTLQMAMKWLREVHKLCITIIPKVTDDDGSGGCLWEWAITYSLVPQSVSLELFESYEQACESAIKYCIENLI